MTRVTATFDVKNKSEPFKGVAMFSPREVWRDKDGMLIANPSYYVPITDGKLDVDLFPAEYYLYVADVRLEFYVPMVNHITLKELLHVRYQP